MNKELTKPVLHAIVQFPPKLGLKESNRKLMPQQAVAFVNQAHGSDAVFAVRMDQDEEARAFAQRMEVESLRQRKAARKAQKETADQEHQPLRDKIAFEAAPETAELMLPRSWQERPQTLH